MTKFGSLIPYLFSSISQHFLFSGHITTEHFSWAGPQFCIQASTEDQRRTGLWFSEDLKAMLEHGHVHKTTGAPSKDSFPPQRRNAPHKTVFAVVPFAGSSERDHHHRVGRNQWLPPKPGSSSKLSWVYSTFSACRLDRKQHSPLQRRKDETETPWTQTDPVLLSNLLSHHQAHHLT